MRGWYALVRVVFGLCPGLVAVLGDTGTQRYGSIAVPGAMGVGYALVTLLPDHQAIRLTYLALLVPALGAMAYLPGGGAALFVLTLPQFWLLTRTPVQAVGLSGAAAAAVVVGALARTDGAIAGNAVVAAAASVPMGVWWHRNEQRTHALGDELARTRQELAEAHRREGAHGSAPGARGRSTTPWRRGSPRSPHWHPASRLGWSPECAPGSRSP